MSELALISSKFLRTIPAKFSHLQQADKQVARGGNFSSRISGTIKYYSSSENPKVILQVGNNLKDTKGLDFVFTTITTLVANLHDAGFTLKCDEDQSTSFSNERWYVFKDGKRVGTIKYSYHTSYCLIEVFVI